MRVRAVLLAAMFALAPLDARAADLVVWWEEGYNPEALLSGSGVVDASRHQGGDELAEEGPAPAPGVVHELEEGEVERQLLLRDAAVRT
jgi:hypothetical protein